MSKVSIKELVDLTGKSRQTVQARLAAIPYEEEEATGRHDRRERRYDSLVALPALLRPDFEKEYKPPAPVLVDPEDPNSGKILDLAAERARLAHHQANKYRLESENLRGNLIEADLVESVWSGQLSNIRAKLLSLPHKAAPRAAVIEDEHQVADYLQGLIYEALSELSEYTPEQYRRAGSKTGTRSTKAAPKTDRKPVG